MCKLGQMVTLQPIPHTTFQLGILAAWYPLLWHVNILQLTKVGISCLSRKPAARLGEVFFANKVSLGGLGAERS